MLWVRPLILANRTTDNIIDLRYTSDLLWPANAFHPAYAEDLLPLWDRLSQQTQAHKDPLAEIPQARQILQTFLKEAWQS